MSQFSTILHFIFIYFVWLFWSRIHKHCFSFCCWGVWTNFCHVYIILKTVKCISAFLNPWKQHWPNVIPECGTFSQSYYITLRGLQFFTSPAKPYFHHHTHINVPSDFVSQGFTVIAQKTKPNIVYWSIQLLINVHIYVYPWIIVCNSYIWSRRILHSRLLSSVYEFTCHSHV